MECFGLRFVVLNEKENEKKERKVSRGPFTQLHRFFRLFVSLSFILSFFLPRFLFLSFYSLPCHVVMTLA